MLRGAQTARTGTAVNPSSGSLSDGFDRGTGEFPPTPFGDFVPLQQTVAQIPPIKEKNGLIKPNFALSNFAL